MGCEALEEMAVRHAFGYARVLGPWMKVQYSDGADSVVCCLSQSCFFPLSKGADTDVHMHIFAVLWPWTQISQRARFFTGEYNRSL